MPAASFLVPSSYLVAALFRLGIFCHILRYIGNTFESLVV
jgi:hypothetical protein